MPLHSTTFEYLKPTDGQIEVMNALRWAAKIYADTLDRALDEGPDKTYILRRVRETAMWVNVALTRMPDGSPRGSVDRSVDPVRAYLDIGTGSNDTGC